MEENGEDVLECSITRLENLLSHCINLFGIIEVNLYNSLIEAVQQYIFLLRARAANTMDLGVEKIQFIMFL